MVVMPRRRSPLCCFLVSWLQVAIEPLALFYHNGFDYTVDPRYLEVKMIFWITLWYPYLDISDLQNAGKK